MGKLTDRELLQLEKYRFNHSLVNSFCPADLLDESFLEDFLKNLAVAIGAPNQKAAASIFIKRYAFLAVMSLYAMTAWNKKLNVSLNHIKIEQAELGKDWLPSISLTDMTVQEWEGKNRENWRDGVLQDLFAHNVNPLISHLEKTIGISRLILWENIAVYIFWLYESVLKDTENDNVAQDFRYLFLDAEGQLFGHFNRNPLQKYVAEKTYMAEWDDEIRIRKTCCFSYQLPAAKRCKTCPCMLSARDGRCQVEESICGSVRGFA
jgi:siderophore-iron reductase FhuF